MNTNVAVSISKKSIGVEVVFRSDSGVFLGALAEIIEGYLDVFVVEALAMLLGLKFVINTGFQNLWVESDAKILVQPIYDDGLSFSSHGLLKKKKFDD